MNPKEILMDVNRALGIAVSKPIVANLRSNVSIIRLLAAKLRGIHGKKRPIFGGRLIDLLSGQVVVAAQLMPSSDCVNGLNPPPLE